MSFADYAALTIHEVKNRLAALAARADSRGDRETVREALAAAHALTALLACYKAENGWLGVDIGAHVPAEMVAELVGELAGSAEPGGGVEVVAAADAPDSVFFYDDALVRLVLGTAIHNARRSAAQRVVVGASADERWLKFTVSDDGPGYPAELLDAPVLEPGSVSDHGTGLGLALARQVAALHDHGGRHGGVVLENRNGAHFTLRLPR